MKAIISDIHGHLSALTAVLSDIRSLGVSEIICLGDIVGGGPNPGECIDLVMQNCSIVVRGNNDPVIRTEAGGVSVPGVSDSAGGERARISFLQRLPDRASDGDLLFVHGSPFRPVSEYVFPEDLLTPGKLDRIFALIPRYCFHGHTHFAGLFAGTQRFFQPADIGFRYTLGEEKLLINPGSVGQPRDGDRRPAYATLDGRELQFRRVG